MSLLQRAMTVAFGLSKANLSTVGYQLLDVNGRPATGARITKGVLELPKGSGNYGASVFVPYWFTGFILWDTGEQTPEYAVWPVTSQFREVSVVVG